jgi:hypothetical protein
MDRLWDIWTGWAVIRKIADSGKKVNIVPARLGGAPRKLYSELRKPASTVVGTSGTAEARDVPLTVSAASFPPAMSLRAAGSGMK